MPNSNFGKLEVTGRKGEEWGDTRGKTKKMQPRTPGPLFENEASNRPGGVNGYRPFEWRVNNTLVSNVRDSKITMDRTEIGAKQQVVGRADGPVEIRVSAPRLSKYSDFEVFASCELGRRF